MSETSALVPVMAMSGKGAIHVLDQSLSANRKWMPGVEGKTVCGRKGIWYFSGIVVDGDRPCKQCDVRAAVAVEMFNADARVKAAVEVQVGHAFEHWVEFGMECGFISEPSCYIHDGIPLSEEEEDEMDETGEPDHCIFVVRVNYP